MNPRIKRALISVSDKTSLGDFARGLVQAGVQIYSTGGTRKFLEQQGLAVQDVAAYTGFPEMMDGRVKTLHPKIHGGILCRHDHAEDMQNVADHGMVSFELVVVNLYPFASTVARPDVSREEAIEQIDIGGPSLVRAAAKNHAFVTVATSPRQYPALLDQIQKAGSTSLEARFRLAGDAFAHTADYDQAIAAYFAKQIGDDASAATPAPADSPFPESWNISLRRKEVLRYGENPHQRAALYAESPAESQPAGAGNLVSARQLHGKELSYNNLLDLDSALAMARAQRDPAAMVIKHNNPCGAATGETLLAACRMALEGDPVSAFGAVLGFNRVLDGPTAELLAEPGRFVEAIVAPEFSPEAVEILTTRPKWKANVRLLAVGALGDEPACWDYRRLAGGMLVQEADNQADPEPDWRVVTARAPSETEWRDLRFAWSMARYVKSNAIVVVKDGALAGVGAGQMSRVDSVEIALRKAAARAQGSSLGSDAFFPFPDSIELAAQAGVTACVQPGGSRNDEAVIAACNERQVAMIFTGRRHFKH